CIINFLPLVVPFVARALEDAGWSIVHCWLLAGLSLVSSKFWLPLAAHYPLRYSWNFGCYMTLLAYAIQGSVARLVAAFLFYPGRPLVLHQRLLWQRPLQ